jgi:hypothetical protein
MLCALFYPVVFSIAIWVLLFGPEVRRGQLSLRSLLLAMALAALNLLLVRIVLRISN